MFGPFLQKWGGLHPADPVLYRYISVIFDEIIVFGQMQVEYQSFDNLQTQGEVSG